MNDLKNTWIKRTRELESYMYNRYNLVCGSNGFFYFNDLEVPHLGYFEKDKQNKKEIHLVNGQFEYVEKDIAKKLEEAKEEDEKLYPDLEGIKTVKQCQFAKYGFKKPDFNCEIFKEVQGNKSRNTKRFIGHVINEDGVSYPCIWEEWGKCEFCTSAKRRKYSLTPLKKEWYEDESNFPCIIVEDDERLILCRNKYEWIDLIEQHNESFRLATKEEVLSLYKEEK